MQNKKNQTSVGQMIQRCHKWRQKRKQYTDLARQTTDEIERERLLQTAEHYCRIANEEKIKQIKMMKSLNLGTQRIHLILVMMTKSDFLILLKI